MIYKFKRWVILPAYTEIFINANSDEEAYSLLKILGFPFRLDNHFERLSELNSAEKTVEEANG